MWFWIGSWSVLSLSVQIWQSMQGTVRRQKGHINFCNINFWAPTQNPPVLGPPVKGLCASFPGKERKRDPQTFCGEFLGLRGGPKRAISGHKNQESPRQTKPKKGPNEKFMHFALFCEFWCFSLGKQARFTLNFCSGMPL